MSNVEEPPSDYDNCVPNSSAWNQVTTQSQDSQLNSLQGTNQLYENGVVNRAYSSVNVTQDASQQCENGQPPEQGMMTTPQYGMTPQGVMHIQQSGAMTQPYPPYSSIQYTLTPNGQQQQQPMVYYVNGQPAPVMFQPVPTKQKPVGAVILSCFTFWLCGILFGLIAFILAMVGRGASNDRKRRNCTTASYAFSIIGIITGFVLIVLLSITLSHYNYCNPSCYYGSYRQDGCIKCCEYRSCSDGSYQDSNRCTQCCPSVYCSSGSYLDSRGCKVCCPSVYCNYGYYNDYRGCKQCCKYEATCQTYFGIRPDNSQCCYNY